ncbi:uncharacterized protein F4822DRAFT_430153 [Hypoxylon trugodes]|uniref:uncharacterized protein n=1 Tax=Hypoxylon trugodes TaxID=326681 RepID=UPI00219C0762|nr:uncharacterized protein F4822DRAFT_430153 [Hypoxylon trugodes]KAI1387407.1 hypothetical protein F4822DRAFT_430153 [Hypoxylon trugodes]
MAHRIQPPPDLTDPDRGDRQGCNILIPRDSRNLLIFVDDPDICHKYRIYGHNFCCLPPSFQDQFKNNCPPHYHLQRDSYTHALSPLPSSPSAPVMEVAVGSVGANTTPTLSTQEANQEDQLDFSLKEIALTAIEIVALIGVVWVVCRGWWLRERRWRKSGLG